MDTIVDIAEGKPEGEGPTSPKEEAAEKTETNEMSDFHRLLVLRMLRPDRLHYALSDYVDKHMPAEQTEPVSYESMKTYLGAHNLATMIVLPTRNTCVPSTTIIDLDVVAVLSDAAKVYSTLCKHRVLVCYRLFTDQVFHGNILTTIFPPTDCFCREIDLFFSFLNWTVPVW